MRNAQAKLLVAKLSYELQTTHIGSSLCMVDVVHDIYATKSLHDHFVLDAGHTFMGYCAVREVLGTGDAKQMYQHHGTHPDKCTSCGIEVSTGSLGLGATIGLGMALAEPQNHVYVATSDGAMAEGCWAEVLNYAEEQKLRNYHVYISTNSWGGYRYIDTTELFLRLNSGYPSVDIRLYQSHVEDYGFEGLEAHYINLDKGRYERLVKKISA